MDAKRLKALIKRGHELNEQMKTSKKELDGIKTELKDEARKTKSEIIKGTGDLAVEFQTVTSTSVDPEDLYDLVGTTEGFGVEEFLSVISVGITETKKLLSAKKFESVSKQEKKRFNKVIFKRIVEVKPKLKSKRVRRLDV